MSYTRGTPNSNVVTAASVITCNVVANTNDTIIALVEADSFHLTATTLTDTAGNTYVPVANIGNSAIAVTFSTAPSGASGSTTIGTAWAGVSGTYGTLLSTGQLLMVTYTASSSTVSWSTAVIGSPTTSATAFYGAIAIGLWICQGATSMSAGTLTATCANNLYAIYAMNYTGLVTSGGIQAFTGSLVGGGGSSPGANVVTPTNTIQATAQAMLWGCTLVAISGISVSPGVGTSPIAFGSNNTTAWNGLLSTTAAPLVTEDALISTTSSVAPTFGSIGLGYDTFITFAMTLGVKPTVSNTAYEIIGTGTTPGDNTGDPARVGGTKLNDALITLFSARGFRATTPGCFGVSNSTGTTTTLIDGTQTWATNQFAGQYVTITTGSAPTVSGSTVTPTSNIGYSSLIASNTATTLTFAALPFATTSGCGYDISPTVTTAQTDGQATSVGGTTPSTLVDGTKSWTTNAWSGYVVTLLGGAYAGQTAPIAYNTSTALTLSTAFATAISAGTPYVIGTGPISASQYVTSGTTVTANPGTLWLELNGPTTMTVTFPSSPYDTQRFEISTTTAITTFATAGGTVSGAPSTMSANTGIAFRYHVGTTTWYRVQ